MGGPLLNLRTWGTYLCHTTELGVACAMSHLGPWYFFDQPLDRSYRSIVDRFVLRDAFRVVGLGDPMVGLGLVNDPKGRFCSFCSGHQPVNPCKPG